jgi:hypothetical protein
MKTNPDKPPPRPRFFWQRAGDSKTVKQTLRQIESSSEASKYQESNLRILRRRDEALAGRISRCTTAEPCGEILCSVCARRYRAWLTSELLHLATQPVPAFIATVLLQAVDAAQLRGVELSTLHGRVRKKLIRADVAAAIGGTEASYEAEQDRWVIHLHLLVFDSLESGRAKLRRAFGDSSLHRPVVCQPLRDRVAQLSYLQKFSTYHRPRSAGSKRGRAYPLKPEQVHQLASWTRRFWFTDFLFVLGLRRRGSRFDHESGFRRALAEAPALFCVRPSGGDGGDGGDGFKQHPRSAFRPSALPTCSVTRSKLNSNQLYRVPVSKRAIREDKKHASGSSIHRTPSSTVATPSMNSSPRRSSSPHRSGEASPPSKSSYRTERK